MSLKLLALAVIAAFWTLAFAIGSGVPLTPFSMAIIIKLSPILAVCIGVALTTTVVGHLSGRYR